MNVFIIDKIKDLNQEGIYYYISDLNKFYDVSNSIIKKFPKDVVKYYLKQWIVTNILQINLPPFAGYSRGTKNLEMIMEQPCKFDGHSISHSFIDYLYCRGINPIKIENGRATIWGTRVYSFRYPNIKIPEVLAIILALKVFFLYLEELNTRLDKISILNLEEEKDKMLRVLKEKHIFYDIKLDKNLVYLRPVKTASTYGFRRDKAGEFLKYFENLLGVDGGFIFNQAFFNTKYEYLKI